MKAGDWVLLIWIFNKIQPSVVPAWIFWTFLVLAVLQIMVDIIKAIQDN